MIGIVLVAHGSMAVGLIAALEHVVGPQQGVLAVCVGADDDMEERRAEILESVKGFADTGAGVILLTDMFGGTPSNLAISIMGHARIEVLAGVNLPMLVKLASVRTRPIVDAVRVAQEAGRKYITVASRLCEEALYISVGPNAAGVNAIAVVLDLVQPAGASSTKRVSCGLIHLGGRDVVLTE